MMDSEKTMQTLFIRFKDHMLYICTLAQWKKYYQSIPDSLVTELHTIQYTQDNEKLIDLILFVNKCEVNLHSEPDSIKLTLQRLKGEINYKEYNTDASGDIGGISLQIGKEKLIENLSLKGMYSHIEFMTVEIAVSFLKFNIFDYSVVEQIISAISIYALKVNPIIKELKKMAGTDQVSIKQEEIIPTSVEDRKYLLETRLALDLQNVEANIIGYKNSIKLVSF